MMENPKLRPGKTEVITTATAIDLCHSIDALVKCSTKVWSNTNIKHANEKNKTKLVIGQESSTKVSRSAVIFEISILPVQFVCHTNLNLIKIIDGASRYFGVWLWQLVHLLILVCSFQWPVLFCLAKLYGSCPIRDKKPIAVTRTTHVTLTEALVIQDSQ